jgi:hypothetical protein
MERMRNYVIRRVRLSASADVICSTGDPSALHTNLEQQLEKCSFAKEIVNE